MKKKKKKVDWILYFMGQLRIAILGWFCRIFLQYYCPIVMKNYIVLLKLGICVSAIFFLLIILQFRGKIAEAQRVQVTCPISTNWIKTSIFKFKSVSKDPLFSNTPGCFFTEIDVTPNYFSSTKGRRMRLGGVVSWQYEAIWLRCNKKWQPVFRWLAH